MDFFFFLQNPLLRSINAGLVAASIVESSNGFSRTTTSERTGRKAQLVSEEIRMLVFLFFGQGDFQTDFCSRLLRSLQETLVHVLIFLFFKLR